MPSSHFITNIKSMTEENNHEDNSHILDKKGQPLNSQNNDNSENDPEEITNLSPNPDKITFNEIPEVKKESLKVRFKKFFKYEKGPSKHVKPIVICGIFIIVITIGALTAASRYSSYAPTDSTPTMIVKKSKPKKPKTIAAVLDGTQVLSELANKHPLAVVVENHPDARPQAGLSKASVVYEVIVEGGITRFLAIFGPQEAEKVGPVRSARTFFANWASEYNAFFVHAGGSTNGLARIQALSLLDLPHDNFAFWRERRPGISSEHTLFTSTLKLREEAKSKSWSKTGDFTTWQFKKDITEKKRPESGKITIDLSSASFKIVYNYDKKTNSYLRTLGGLPHTDQTTGKQLKPKNIVIQKVSRSELMSGGKLVGQISDVGSGDALIFIDGKVIEGTWSKTADKRRTLFYNSDGAEIKFNPGQSFIEVIDPTSEITYELGKIVETSSETDSNSTCTDNTLTNCTQ